MPVPLPRVIETPGKPDRRKIDAKSNWIFLFPHPFGRSAQQGFPYATAMARRRQKADRKPAENEPFIMDLPNSRSSHASFACIDPDIPSFELLTLARKLAAVHDVTRINEVAVSVHGFDNDATERLAEAVITAVFAAAAEMPVFKTNNRSLLNDYGFTGLRAGMVSSGPGPRRKVTP